MNKSFKLSFITGSYTFTVLLLFSAIILSWTYSTSRAVLEQEIDFSFVQRHKSVRSFFAEEADFIDNFGKIVAKSEILIEGLSSGSYELVESQLNRVQDGYIRSPDILIVSDFQRSRYIDASQPLYRIDDIFTLISEDMQNFLSGAIFLEISQSPDTALIIMKATEIINSESGKVVGYVFCGTFIENNFSLLSPLREAASAEIVLITYKGRIVATTDKRTSVLTRTIHEAVRNGDSSRFIELETGGDGYLFSSSSVSLLSYEPLIVTLGVGNSPFQELKREFFRKSVIFFIFSLLLILIYRFLFRWLTALPLRKLMEYSDRIEAGDLEYQYEKSRISEFNQLGYRLHQLVKNIRAGEERLKQFAEATWEAIVIQKDGVILEANDQFFQMFGYSREEDEKLFKNRDYISRIYNGESLAMVKDHIENNLSESYEVEGVKKDGMTFPVEVRIRYIKSEGEELRVAAIRDLTERKKVAELMIQTEKMMSVGGLAAGMAHEINNPLAGMVQTAFVLEKRLLDNSPANREAAKSTDISLSDLQNYMELRGVPKMLNEINESGLRVASIVKNMLQFSRKGVFNRTLNSLEELLEKAVEIASSDYNLAHHYDFKSIAIQRNFEKGVPGVLCDGGSIQQVCLNILRNSSEAMHEAGTEMPSISLAIKYLKDKKVVSLEILDNGPGMDETTKKRIFEPFYTTKPVGKGTGLGLSVSYFIISENHGGEMSVESRLGQGTKFIIRLPG